MEIRQGIKGNTFKKMLPLLPFVRQITEWHFKITGSNERKWNLYFNQHGRMKFAAEKSNESYEGISPERVIRFVGWEEQTVNDAIALSGVKVTTDVRYENVG